MKKLLRQSILVACAFAMLTGGLCYASGTKPPSNANDSFVTTPTNGNKIDLGPTIELDAKGYPTKDSRQILLDEVAFQGAVAAYLQSIPRMSMYGSLKSAHYYGAAGNTDIFIQYKDPSVDGMLTPNRVVAYVWNYANLEKAGPLVYEFPAGATAGIIMDIQMRWYADLGTTSPLGGASNGQILVAHRRSGNS